ncbi:SgcJ/EcaC family oxidoreductase [Solwaraspora sp. WMMA2056]|uniref:SgcJ/EcaC family oxidoreductase n=1 Tax=Solwaraspora sp. WMMA2056 TaxID=3015161 RepID=UPI00259B6B8E|nr:SgcJ/EcaC family oxidoreductase [Solwaraspora sp. WMMA2056]WJK42572.1 SgcJ/EcaC family oxidoreductase [Solwaraspora sp. WMMA2056]
MSIDSATTVTDADRAAVAALPQRVVAAWAAHDATAFAGVFASDGTLILPGLFLKGRDKIGAYMDQAFAGPYKGTRVTGQPFDVKFLSTDVALMLTEGGVLLPGETDVADGRAIRASWLATKVNGQWHLAAYQNTPRDTA